jgi:hypothetical protein
MGTYARRDSVEKPSLHSLPVSCQSGANKATKKTHPLLVHQSLIRTVIDDTSAEYRCRELAVDFLGIQVGVFAIENEIIAFSTKEHGCGFSKKNKGKTISIFGSALSKKLVRIYSVLNRAAYEREKMEHYRRAVWVCEAQLPDHILGNDRHADEDEGERN